MYRPGGLGGLPPVIKNLLILNVLAFLLTYMIGGWNIQTNPIVDYLALHYPTSPYFRPYQLITYMFTHGGFMHIFFNLFTLWMFGVEIEHIWGPKRFLVYYIICGLGAAALHFGIAALRMHEYGIGSMEAMMIRDSPLLGASGAIYGVLAAFGMMFPNRMLLLLIPPIPMKAKFLVIGYAALELYLGISNSATDNVAHFAHLGGMVAGLIMLILWKSQGKLYG